MVQSGTSVVEKCIVYERVDFGSCKHANSIIGTWTARVSQAKQFNAGTTCGLR